jgi:hypothetical protein
MNFTILSLRSALKGYNPSGEQKGVGPGLHAAYIPVYGAGAVQSLEEEAATAQEDQEVPEFPSRRLRVLA